MNEKKINILNTNGFGINEEYLDKIHNYTRFMREIQESLKWRGYIIPTETNIVFVTKIARKPTAKYFIAGFEMTSPKPTNTPDYEYPEEIFAKIKFDERLTDNSHKKEGLHENIIEAIESVSKGKSVNKEIFLVSSCMSTSLKEKLIGNGYHLNKIMPKKKIRESYQYLHQP